jgi:tetratricopeptide (TPR) repeat protein/tRNA A-37 threonylcarbamoyl transferase component Bud32
VQRELGGGGMSRVFLAEETRLGRHVVIKVLPPEMGAGVNAERFEREIQLAARLQHPHIVPLLSAGSQGDILYYVMPYIQGESLRVKLARDGELPVRDAVRLLREVVQALAYAHRHGVVHRDIKPDNILLADGYAVVTDFGVAKAVSASSGSETSLTSMGVALGTPAYMAPEQAAADPHVDHRADLYAVGALGYEMLCGRPPFVETTPQAVLAAHLTRTPEPLARFRPNVSPQLETLIARCLEKRPADRWQTAAELLPQLDAMATTTAGMTPPATQPAISAATEQALRQGHPVRVAVLFAAASAIVLAAVSFLMYRLGLPDWVLLAAGVLLLIGLPIMVVTGLHERRRAVARTTTVITPPERGPVRWFTWQRALLGGGLAFAGLTVAAAVYTGMRLLGIGAVGTLVASGALEKRDPILLADFENRAGDSTLGIAVTEALRVDLSQSPTIRLLDPSAIGDALQRMQRSTTEKIPVRVARELAERLGAKAIVAGQIDRIAGAYVLSVSVVAADDGRVLTAVRETARDSARLLRTVDKLSSKLRERIGESLVTIRATPPLEQVTTGSLSALRKYSEAMQLADAGRQEEAVPLLEDAIALDTGFAMANRKLAVIIDNIGGSTERAVEATTKAYLRRERLTGIERDLATANYFGYVEYDPAKVAAAYRSVLASDPDNNIALNNLALLLLHQRRWAEAESLALRAVRVGGNSASFFHDNLFEAQVALGHFADARATVEAETKLSGGGSLSLVHRAALAANEGNAAAAEQYIGKLRETERSSPALQARTSLLLASISEQRGKLAEATQYLRDRMAVDEARGLPQEYVNDATFLADFELQYRGRPAQALDIVATALARHPIDSMPRLDRPLLRLAEIYATAGQIEQAKQVMRRFETEVPEGIRRGMWWRHWAEGLIAQAEGRSKDALAAFRALYDEGGQCGVCGLYDLAGAYNALGQVDSAIAIYERYLTTPAASRLRADGRWLAPSLKRLGELYESKGDRKKAAHYYGRFVDLWKDADPELQPGVREVRQRLARLAQEPGM